MPTPKKAYSFTLNNYTDVEYESLCRVCETEGRYAILGKEVGASGTPHIQGYIIFTKSYRFQSIKDRYLPRCHIEVSAGTADDNRRYCSKDGNFREFGTKPVDAKGRDELAQRFVQAMESRGSGLVEFSNEFPGTWFYSGHNLLRNYLCIQPPVHRPDVSCRWYYGPAGSGKSRRAHEEAPEAYIKEPRTKWWNGYMLETDVIIDDFGPNGVDINHLLRWFDRYKCLVESKGGMLPLYATRFIVTSNFHPNNVYCGFGGEPHPQMPALLRRIVIEEITNE